MVWHPPENMGRPIYQLATRWSTRRAPGLPYGTTGVGSVSGGTTVEITGLEADTSYDVRVQADEQ